MALTSRLFRISLLVALSAALLSAGAPTFTKLLAAKRGAQSVETVLICGADGVVAVPTHTIGLSPFADTRQPPAMPLQGKHDAGCPYCGVTFLSVVADPGLRFDGWCAPIPPASSVALPAPYAGWVLMPSRAPPLSA